jgi:hypothetical protein
MFQIHQQRLHDQTRRDQRGRQGWQRFAQFVYLATRPVVDGQGDDSGSVRFDLGTQVKKRLEISVPVNAEAVCGQRS